MGEKERYGTIGTWVEVFRGEGIILQRNSIYSRLSNLSVVGITGRTQDGRLFRKGFFSEADVRNACADILNPLDSTYFNDPAKLRADLTAMAGQLGNDAVPQDLNTGNCLELKFSCQNCRSVSGYQYLTAAAIAYGYAHDSDDAKKYMARVMKDLITTAGFEVMDEAYFSDPSKLRVDLETFAEALGEDSPLYLSASSLGKVEIKCQNGQSMNGQRYLGLAAVVLGYAKTVQESRYISVEIYENLLRIAGFELLDRAYFEDRAKVKADLMALAAQVGEGVDPINLTTANIKTISIICLNGRAMMGQPYIQAAAKALGFSKNTTEANTKLAYTLKYLQKFAGFDVLDEVYYQDPEKVRADLEAFGRQLGDNSSVLDLNTGNIVSLSITCQNGQVKTGLSYLGRAAVVLRFAENGTSARLKIFPALKQLFKIAGFHPFDKDYFLDSSRVRADLTAFAEASGRDVTAATISTSYGAYSAQCQNGQTLKWDNYLVTAGQALGFTRIKNEAHGKRSKVLLELKRIAGLLSESTESNDR